ncbi:MAG: hypothetical protein ACYDCK_07505 [Thermoplasmatota archaeon]
MELARALADGEAFVKNAQDEMERKILREDQLYFIENQVEALDTFLADTEDLQDGSPELAALRDKLRAAKAQLEKKSIEFLAQQEGGELPEDVPPEEAAKDFVGYGKEFLQMADDALKAKITKIDQVSQWEDPITILNSFLADSEMSVKFAPELTKIRSELKSRKKELEKRVQDLVGAWKQQDLAGGDEDEE